MLFTKFAVYCLIVWHLLITWRQQQFYFVFEYIFCKLVNSWTHNWPPKHRIFPERFRRCLAEGLWNRSESKANLLDRVHCFSFVSFIINLIFVQARPTIINCDAVLSVRGYVEYKATHRNKQSQSQNKYIAAQLCECDRKIVYARRLINDKPKSIGFSLFLVRLKAFLENSNSLYSSELFLAIVVSMCF